MLSSDTWWSSGFHSYIPRRPWRVVRILGAGKLISWRVSVWGHRVGLDIPLGNSQLSALTDLKRMFQAPAWGAEISGDGVARRERRGGPHSVHALSFNASFKILSLVPCTVPVTLIRSQNKTRFLLGDNSHLALWAGRMGLQPGRLALALPSPPTLCSNRDPCSPRPASHLPELC